MTHFGQVTPYGIIDVSHGNGLLPDGNEPARKSMLTCEQMCSWASIH